MPRPWNLLEWKDWLASFPLEVTACIQFEIFQSEQCPVEQKARWYIEWWLSMANLQYCVSLEEAEEILLLWAYTWPSSSLKEALCRLGARTIVAYQEVSTIAAWNSRAWDSNAFLVPWLGENASDQGNFILRSHGVCSALWVKDTEAQWMCGRVWVHIPCQNLSQFLAANEDVEVYRLVAWTCISLIPLDVCGGARQEHAKPQVGDRVLALQEPWLSKILIGEKSIELRSQLAQEGFVWLAKGNVIYGSAKIEHCEVLTKKKFVELGMRHCVLGTELPYKGRTYGLWLTEVQQLEQPVAFYRLRGSCGWARVRYGPNDAVRPSGSRKRRSTATPWPMQCDLCLFQPARSFVPTTGRLQLDDSIALPSGVAGLAGQTLISANTLGDGACAIHAAFGKTNRNGQLECVSARSLAAKALTDALRCESGYLNERIAAVRMSLWDELALPAAAGMDSVEAQIFWRNLSELYPEEAGKVREAVAVEAERTTELTKQKYKLAKACRSFFVNGTVSCIESLCSRIGYATNEGAEDCFEERRDGKYVKGTRNSVWPAEGPMKKMDAIRYDHDAFDSLRLAVFLARDLEMCIEVLKDIAKDMENVEGERLQKELEEYLRQAEQSEDKVRPTQPQSFYDAAVDAYLCSVMEDGYYFSYDEVATVAERRGQGLLIVKEDEAANFVPCCAVQNGSNRQPVIIILVKNANSSGRVRSHFERLASQAQVKAKLDAAIEYSDGHGERQSAVTTCMTQIEEDSLAQEKTQETLAGGAASFSDIDCPLQENKLSEDEPFGTEIPTGRPQFDDAETRTGDAAKEGCSSEDEA